ncbi:hypothetical protein Tco_0742676 [Tanacetum coccineum]
MLISRSHLKWAIPLSVSSKETLTKGTHWYRRLCGAVTVLNVNHEEDSAFLEALNDLVKKLSAAVRWKEKGSGLVGGVVFGVVGVSVSASVISGLLLAVVKRAGLGGLPT